jgi:hypothetical protein
LKGVATAFGIISDKILLAQGKPTTIHGEAMAMPTDATPDQLVLIADELTSSSARPRATLRSCSTGFAGCATGFSPIPLQGTCS